MATKTGSETLGAAGDKNRMTLFRDDRQEDIGAIVLAAIVIAIIMILTMKGPEPAPATAPTAEPPASTMPAPTQPAEPAKK